MKKQILMLVLGIVIGAVVTAGGFLIFGKNNNKQMDKMGRDGEPPMSMDGNFIDDGGMKGRHNDENEIPQDNVTNSEDSNV